MRGATAPAAKYPARAREIPEETTLLQRVTTLLRSFNKASEKPTINRRSRKLKENGGKPQTHMIILKNAEREKKPAKVASNCLWDICLTSLT